MGILLERNATQNDCGQNIRILNLSIVMAVFIIGLALCAGTAWSFDGAEQRAKLQNVKNTYTQTQKSPQPTRTNLSEHSSSPAIADACLSLLNTIRHTSASTAMNRNQRTAGTMVALGLVFGARFALKPSSNAASPHSRLDEASYDSTAKSNRRAYAIAEYRRCQKNQALRASVQAFDDFSSGPGTQPAS